MPLIFFILLIVVVLMWSKGVFERDASSNSFAAKEVRKTNAKRELEIMDGFVKKGYSLDEARSATAKMIIQEGFSPTIPREAYEIRSTFDGKVYGYRTKLYSRQYDSAAVRQRYDRAKYIWLLTHDKGEEMPEPSYDEIYNNFPKSLSDYKYEVERDRCLIGAFPKGTLVTKPGYDVCEVVGHTEVLGGLGWNYTLKVLRTDELIHVSFKDTSIKKL